MKGVCQRCQCTAETPCMVDGVPCAWIDDREDLCSACAALIFEGGFRADTLEEANYSIHLLAVQVVQLTLQVEQLIKWAQSGGRTPKANAPAIWTPGSDR